MLVSATDLSSYLFCPRKLYARKVLKIKESLNQAMVAGSVRHHVHDFIAKEQKRLVQQVQQHSTAEEVKLLFREQYLLHLKGAVEAKENKERIQDIESNPEQVILNMWPSLQNMADSDSLRILEFAKKHKLSGAVLWEELNPKPISEEWLSSKTLGLKGIVDLIEKYPDRSVPVELKTGKAPIRGVWAGHRIQLGTYQLLLAEKLQEPVTEGYVRYLDYQQDRPVMLNPLLKQEVFKIRDKVVSLLEGQQLPEPCGKHICQCKSILGEQRTLHNL